MADWKSWLVPGNKIRLSWGPNNPHNEVHHIRGIVDDQIVIRRWVKHKARWCYECHHLDYYELHYKGGHLEKA